MKSLICILAILLAGCNSSASTKILSYEELVNYPNSCAKKDSQLKELRELQRIKNFNPDPDVLNDSDRAYNSRLKSTIWWFAYRCE